jgi:hypothetical protein
VIDADNVKQHGKKLAQRLAVDASVFDQYACSSPHTVFVEESEPGDAKKFAELLAKQMDLVNRTLLPKGQIDSDKAMEIINVRTMHQLIGQVWQSSGTEWTVLYDEQPGLFAGCFARVIMVKPLKDWHQLAELNDRQKQTLGVAMTEANKLKYLDAITRNGVDRCPDFGEMTWFDSPWDGMFVFDRLVRWVTCYK